MREEIGAAMRLTPLLATFLCVASTACPCSVASADTKTVLRIQGATDLDHDEPHEDHWDSRNQLEVTQDGVLGQALTYQVSGRAKGDFFGDGDVDQDIDLEVYDSYLMYRAERLDLKVGNLVVQWGKMDELVLTDNVNGQDLDQFILPWKEERKLATPMAQAQIYLSGLTIEILVSPQPTINRITFFGSDWAFFRHNRELGAELSPDSATAEFFDSLGVDADAPEWGDVEYGGRLRSTIREVDFALSALVHHQRNPVFRGDELALAAAFEPEQAVARLPTNPTARAALLSATSPEITASYPWLVTLGGEFETVVGNYGLRGEIAHTINAEYQGEDLTVAEGDQTLFGIGVDLTYDALYANVQLVHQWVQEAEPLLFTRKQAATLVFVLEYETFQGTVTPAFYAAWDLADNASYLRPRVLYKQSDLLTLEVGLDIFTGDEETALGTFGTNDQVYLLAIVSF
jgi:hypothetical protein